MARINISRSIQIRKNNIWKPYRFERVKCGDVLRMLESDGTVVRNSDGISAAFVATKPAYLKPSAKNSNELTWMMETKELSDD